MNILKNMVRLILGFTGFICDIYTLCNLSANIWGGNTPWWEEVSPQAVEHLIQLDQFSAEGCK